MAYTAPQIGTILLKADRTMYKIGQIAYENMFAEDNEALDYERDVIFIYKKAVEYADDFFVGTDKLDKVVERLATKISAYDYGELNPIYADALTVNIPVVVAGAALNDLTDVTITNLLDNQLLRYNAATGQWINVGPGSAVRSSQAFIATAGQTVFTTSAPFDAGLFDLYVNGVKLNSLSYTTFGEYQITLNDPCVSGDIVDVVIYDPNTGINPTANTLNDLTDVNIGPLANKQGLYYNSTSGLWENGQVFVPYTGAVGAVDLGENEIKAGQFTLDLTPTGTAAVGTTRWNDSMGVPETTLKGGNVVAKNGVDLVVRVVNKVTPNATLTKANYTAVRISGAQGQRLAVGYAQANNDANSADTIGVVIETIPTNQEGFVMTMGQLEGINTTGSLQGETWLDGDVLYLSPTTPGRLTNIKPTGLTGHIVVMGYVEHAHINQGKIYVKIMNGWELDELHNVNINQLTLANGDVLKYNSTTQLWENGVDAGGITGTGVAGQVPYFTGTSAVAGSNNLFWDATNNGLVVGSNTISSFFRLGVNGNIVVSGASPYITFNTATNSGSTPAYIQYVNSTSLLNIISTGAIDFYTNANQRMRLFAGGNVLIGSTSDLGVRFGVIGDTLLRGSGNTSATTALTVQNSDSNFILSARNDRRVWIYSNSNITGLVVGDTIGSSAGTNISSNEIRFNPGGTILHSTTSGSNADNGGIIIRSNSTLNPTVNNPKDLSVSSTFAPTSGTGTYVSTIINPTINQTGGANGITRGLYVNPTLTAAADFRAIETTAGNVLFGSNFTWNNTINRLDLNGTDSGDSVRIINRGYITFSDTTNTLTSRFRGIAAGFVFQDAAYNTRAQISTGAGLTYFNAAGGGVMIGTSTDLGVRLGVSGDTILRGSGNTNATTALTVQNSDGTNLIRAGNDNLVTVTNLSVSNTGGTTLSMPGSNNFFHDAVGTGGKIVFRGGGVRRMIFSGAGSGLVINPTADNENNLTGEIKVSSRILNNAHVIHANTTPNFTGPAVVATFSATGTVAFDPTNVVTGGHMHGLYIAESFAPNTANKDINYTGVRISSTINQTGGAVAVTRGILIDPTLTAAADFRAIETTAGNVLFGSNFFWDNANGRLGIGTNVPATALNIIQTRATISLRDTTVANSSTVFFGAYDDYLQIASNRNPSTGVYSNINKASSQISLEGGANSGIISFFNTNTNNSIPTEKVRIGNTGNLLIQNGGTFTDNGQRLQVYGDTLLRGSGATSATTALTVQNSSSTNLLRVNNLGEVILGNSTTTLTGNRIFFDFALDYGGDFTSRAAGTEAMSFGFNTQGNFGGTASNISGRTIYFFDRVGSTYLGGINPTNGFYIGQSTTRYGLNVQPANASITALTVKSNGGINMSHLPTSSTGLAAGDLWNNGGVINIV